MKIQERSGTMIQQILHKSNPWAKEPCDRADCLVCRGGEENAGECKRRNVVYRTCCLKCKEKGENRYYYGETSRSSYERGKEHQADSISMSTDSHMVKHAVVEHEGDTEIKFSMKVLKVHRTAFRRQIHEAVMIQRNEQNSILNSKGEYNCCSLPRLTVMMGNKEAKEKEKEVREPLTDQEIEQEIIKMKNKKRKSEIGDAGRPPQNKKRRKWRIEFRKDLQQKRIREFSQAENEMQRETKRRKINAQQKDQQSSLLKNSNQNQKEISQNHLKNNSKYFPIFTFNAVRQREEWEDNHSYKAKPSQPATKGKVQKIVKTKKKPSQSPTPTQPKQARIRRKLDVPTFNYKPLDQHFPSTKQMAFFEGLIESESRLEDHHHHPT